MFGTEEWSDVPISKAVSASTALPMVYKPVEVRGRELVDGGIVSTTNLDIAVEAGAKFIVVVNPLVPYVNDFSKPHRTLFGTRPRHVSDMGFPQIGYQTFKLLAYQRLHEMARQWEQRYPGVDIVLIEPEPDDDLMFETIDPELRQAGRRRPPRLPVRHAAPGRGVRLVPRDLRAARHRDLRHAGPQGGAPLRRGGGAHARLAQDPRADDGHAAAAVRGGLTQQRGAGLSPRTTRRSRRRTSR